MSQNIQITVENGVKELVIREGKALDLIAPIQVVANGTIETVADYIEKRKHLIDKDKAIIFYSIKHGAILLREDPSNVRGACIKGEIKETELFQNLSINNKNRMNKDAMVDWVRRYGRFFVAENPTILAKDFIKSLQNFQAKFESQVTSEDDRKGNTNESIKKFINIEKGLIPLEFKLRIPPFEGVDAWIELDVEVEIEQQNNSIVFMLFCFDKDSLVEDLKDRVIAEELSGLGDYVIIQEG